MLVARFERQIQSAKLYIYYRAEILPRRPNPVPDLTIALIFTLNRHKWPLKHSSSPPNPINPYTHFWLLTKFRRSGLLFDYDQKMVKKHEYFGLTRLVIVIIVQNVGIQLEVELSIEQLFRLLFGPK